MSEMTYFVLFGVEIFTNRSTDLENYSYKGGIYIYKYKYIQGVPKKVSIKTIF